MDCVFCKIIAGEIPSFKLYEDEGVFVFLDIHPASKGHTLVIPKQHAENIFDITEESLKNVTAAGKHFSEKLQKALKADGIRLAPSNGKAAGQEVMHFHLHVIPRYENDGVSLSLASTPHAEQADFEELKKLQEIINQ